MSVFSPGLVHVPVTPFTRDNRIDFECYAKLLAFHLAQGAEALALVMHEGESVSLGDDEQRELIEFAVRQVGGRVPVIAHASDSGTAIAADRARHAETAGAAAIVATTPYYWTPPPAMVIEHFAGIGAAVSIPFFVYYAPAEMGGLKLSADQVLGLLERLDNFAGVVDASFDWQFMINILSRAQQVRPEFQLLAGAEYLVSAGAIGATGLFSALAGVAPKQVRRLYEICRTEKYFDARRPQEDLAALRRTIKQAGGGGLKGALRAMGRNCGDPRPPLEPLGGAYAQLESTFQAMAWLGEEPRGW